LPACSGKSMAFATANSVSVWHSLTELSSSEWAFSALTTMKVAEVPGWSERAGRCSSRPGTNHGCGEGDEDATFLSPIKGQTRKRSAWLFFPRHFVFGDTVRRHSSRCAIRACSARQFGTLPRVQIAASVLLCP
jgi:hypothetical protein